MSTPLSNIEQIIQHEADAERLEADADGHRWEAARLISEELATGKPQRQLAREINKSQSHVSKMKAVWEKYGTDSPENRPAFQDAYLEVSSKKPKSPKPKPNGDGNGGADNDDDNGEPDPFIGQQKKQRTFERYCKRVTKLGGDIKGLSLNRAQREKMADLLELAARELRQPE